MKKINILPLFFVLCLALVGNVEAGFWDNLKSIVFKPNAKAPPSIDVLIVNDKPSVMVEIKGPYHLFDPNTKQNIGKRTLGKKKHMESLASGLKWGEEFPGVYQLYLAPEDISITTVVDGKEYRGSLIIYDIGGSISIVNRVPIEDYLSSILPAKIQDPLPEETMAAFAIAMRTNAYYFSKHPKNKFWSVDATQVGYHGLESTHIGGEVDHAIQATRHMVLSKTGAYEGVVTPFAAQWGVLTGSKQAVSHAEFARISLYEAEDMGRSGKHAAQILSKAFPDSHIELIY